MTVLFKSWLMNGQCVGQLEAEDIRFQLESMKENISPSFLSRILKMSASLGDSDPKEASVVLLTLSKILRYQLYDCSRDKVLLNTEIDFLSNYLNLEKIYCKNLDFTISKEGNVNHIFIPPLLFIPFIQSMIAQMQGQKCISIFNIQFVVKDNQLIFSCMNNGIDKMGYSDIRHRLELIYPDRYSIDVQQEERVLIIQISI